MDKNLMLTPAEEKLARLIWRKAPLSSPELVLLADWELDWKKSTTYTILKKLCDKGVFKNQNAQVSVVLTRDALVELQSRRYVENTFDGSLPKFIATFMGGNKLSSKQAEELKRLIAEYEKE